MRLILDVGNTQTVLAVYDGLVERGQWRMVTDARRTRDEYCVWFSQFLAMKQISPDLISQCILGSVVPPVKFGLVQALRHLFEVGTADGDGGKPGGAGDGD